MLSQLASLFHCSTRMGVPSSAWIAAYPSSSMSPARSNTADLLVLMSSSIRRQAGAQLTPGYEVDDAHAVEAHDHRVDLDETHILVHRVEKRRYQGADRCDVVTAAAAVAVQELAQRGSAKHLLPAGGRPPAPQDRLPRHRLGGGGAGAHEDERPELLVANRGHHQLKAWRGQLLGDDHIAVVGADGRQRVKGARQLVGLARYPDCATLAAVGDAPPRGLEHQREAEVGDRVGGLVRARDDPPPGPRKRR